MCINAIQLDHDQELFFFSFEYFFSAGLALEWRVSLNLVCPLLHIFSYACKMCFPFEQIVHNRIRGGLKNEEKIGG